MDSPHFGTGDRVLLISALCLLAFRLLPLSAFLAFFATLLAVWIYLQYHEKQYWHRHGVPGPRVNIFFGTTIELLRKGAIVADKETFQKYGKSYGSFVFGRREFCTMDKEIMRRVFVKDFQHFQNRFNFLPEKSDAVEQSMMRNAVTVLTDEDWKRVRSCVTPAFTTGKLKKLIPILCESTNLLSEVIESKYITKGKELPLKDLFGRLVLDQIGRAGFSLDLNTFGEQDNIFVRNTNGIRASKWFILKLMFLAFCPFLSRLYERWTGTDAMTNSAIKFFEQFMGQLYEQRKADPEAKEKYTDIFQLLINAVEENEPLGEIDAEIMHKELMEQRKSGKRHLTRMELCAQSFILLVAGYETTASTLHFAIHQLAMCPDVQQSMREEVLRVLGEEEEVTYEHLRAMPYVQAVVQETLRMYPLAPKTNRQCSSDTEIEGIPIRKGDLVSVPIYLIQHSEEYYPEPEKFNPERFMPEQKQLRDPLNFLTFGYGPRNCIGMRFAEFQMNVTLALLVRRFRFRPGINTPNVPLELTATDLLRPVKTLVVNAERIF